MSFGGYHPFPRRFGGGKPLHEIVHKSLAAGRGNALDATTPGTAVYIETLAHARAITFDGYGINERLGYQFDPERMSDYLHRWEKIFGIVVPVNSTVSERQQIVLLRMKRFTEASALHSQLISRLTTELGSIFVAIEYIDISNAVVHAPDPSYTWGTVVEGYPWYSTVAHILVLLEKPSGYSEADFYTAAGKVFTALDGLVPADVTFDWYRAPNAYPAIAVSGGPSRAGFYLDDERNLDNNVFDV